MKTIMITLMIALCGLTASAQSPTQYNEYGNTITQYGPPTYTGGTVNTPAESFALYAQDQVDAPTVINEVYPNPAMATSSVVLNEATVNPVTLFVVDLNGTIQKTYSYDGGSNRFSFDVSDLRDGVYSIQVQEKGKSMQSVRLLKQS